MTHDGELPPFHAELMLDSVSGDQIAGRLSRRLGNLSGLRVASVDAPPVPIATWEAIDAEGREVSGEVVLHHAVDADRITVWVELSNSPN